MSAKSHRSKYRPEGWPSVVPRIVVERPGELVRFIRDVFGATGEFHESRPTELRIGDSLLMISGSDERDTVGAFLYVYVEDTDATYRRALEAGATSVEQPVDTAYGDRRAMLTDSWGNTWQIATHSGQFTP